MRYSNDRSDRDTVATVVSRARSADGEQVPPEPKPPQGGQYSRDGAYSFQGSYHTEH